MTRNRRATLYALGAVALWSTVATAFKLALRHQSPLMLITTASAVSWLVFTALLAGRRELRAALRGGWRTAAWSGLLNPVAYYLLLFAAYDRLPGQEAMALNYTWALTMSLLAVPVLGQRLSARDLIAGVVAYAGVWVIATRGAVTQVHFADPVGVAAALASTVLWAAYWLASARDRREPVVGQWQNFTIALPVLAGLCLWREGVPSVPLPGLLAAVYIGLFELGIAFVLWQLALRYTTRAASVASLIFLSPPASLCFLALVAGEPLLPSTLPGLLLILTGLALRPRPPAEDA